MNAPMYPLNLVGWPGSQVIAHAKALVGTVNTASLNLPAVQEGPVLFRYDFVQLKPPGRSPPSVIRKEYIFTCYLGVLLLYFRLI